MAAASKRTYPAESADIKHYISGQKKRNDHYLHAVIQFDRPIQFELLKKAVQATAKAVPLLSCRFVETEEEAYWQEAGWKPQDMVYLINTDDREKTLYENLIVKLDEKKGPQLRLAVVRDTQGDSLAIVMNHMVCDGGGIKDYLYLLSRCYTSLHDNSDDDLQKLLFPGRRSINQVFDAMTDSQLEKIKNAELHQHLQSGKDRLPLTGDENRPFIITHKISSNQFDTIKNYTKQRGATINDALFSAYVCALSRTLETSRIVLDCPVNIRTFLPKDVQPGICNLTSNIVCAVPATAGESFDKALQSVKEVMDTQKGSLEPLKVYWDLEQTYQTLPLQEAKKHFPKIYSIPFNGMTNIGILDDRQLRFGDAQPIDAYISGSIKYTPYFQVAVTTFRKEMTFSTNFHGTKEDYEWLDHFVNQMIGYLPD